MMVGGGLFNVVRGRLLCCVRCFSFLKDKERKGEEKDKKEEEKKREEKREEKGECRVA